MTDQMPLEEYLAKGGRLTSPGNVPPRYRAELMKLMATLVDSELAGAAGFADVINAGPGIKERIAAARIVLEKTDNAERVLRVMESFGANADRYATSHPWTARLERDADIGAQRSAHDMRLSVFNYPLDGWTDAVVMNLLMGRAVVEQLGDLARASYQPFAEAVRKVLPVEEAHARLAAEGTQKLAESDKAGVEAALAYWWPRVSASFGTGGAARFDKLKSWGLRQTTGEELRSAWADGLRTELKGWGLTAPE